MCKLDILKHYGFVVSANQTIYVSNYDPMILISSTNTTSNSTSNNDTSTTSTITNNPISNGGNDAGDSDMNNVVTSTSENARNAITVNNTISVNIEQITETQQERTNNNNNHNRPSRQNNSSTNLCSMNDGSLNSMTDSRRITDV